jgi:hypothetical protein
MIGIDIGIHSLDIPYKKKNLSLIKIDYWNYESFYCKIDPTRLISKKSKSPVLISKEEKSKDFGVFNLVSDNEISELHLNGKNAAISHELCIEMYEEYELIEGSKEVPVGNGLELVCAGKIILSNYEWITSPIHPLFKSDSLMNCCSFLSLLATSSNKHFEAINLSNNQRLSSSSMSSSSADHILKIPLFYKTQNRFAISAGSLSLSIKLYRVDEIKLKAQHSSCFPSDYCSCCQPPPIPRMKEVVKERHHDSSFQSETTHDKVTEDEEDSDSDEEYDRKDDDSLDEFIESFLKRYDNTDHGMQHATVEEHFLPVPPPAPAVKRKKSAAQKKKKPLVSNSTKNRDYVEENKIFPKPRKPSRTEKLRYLKFK